VCDYSNISTEALTWSFLLGKNEIFELVTLREVIEQRCIEDMVDKVRHAPKDAEDTLKELDGQLEKMRRALTANLIEDQIVADYEFHRAIIRSSGNEVFIGVYQTLGAFIREEIEKTNADETTRNSAVLEHEGLLQAIKAGDTARSLAVYREHLRNTRQQLAQSLNLSG
jgi:DNA-binding FadR family transcriptional regulator